MNSNAKRTWITDELLRFFQLSFPCFFYCRVQDVIVFIAGGVTYEESLAVHQFQRSNSGVRVVLGGTCLHNSQTYLADVEVAARGAQPAKKSAGAGASARHVKYTWSFEKKCSFGTERIKI